MNGTFTNQTQASEIETDTSTPEFTLPSWDAESVSIATSVDSTRARHIFYIGTDKKLHELREEGVEWNLAANESERPGRPRIRPVRLWLYLTNRARAKPGYIIWSMAALSKPTEMVPATGMMLRLCPPNLQTLLMVAYRQEGMNPRRPMGKIQTRRMRGYLMA